MQREGRSKHLDGIENANDGATSVKTNLADDGTGVAVKAAATGAGAGPASDELLRVEGLKTYFYTEDGIVKAVDGIDFSLRRGEVLGIAGESGCGKSVTALSIMRLISQPGKIVGGHIWFDGKDLASTSEDAMTHIRGNRISMIFQQPTSCLNPVFKVGDQIVEVLKVHKRMSDRAAKDRAVELLTMVGIPSAKKRFDSYPHEMSGGMCQRVMIAMGLANEPELLIADEPTTALDVTIQAQILELMKALKKDINTAIILITHDLGVMAEMAERMVIMYAGKVVEQTDTNSLYESPKHPYTQGLLASIPVLGQVRERLEVIPGTVPSLRNLPPGCRFAARCPRQMPVCVDEEPDLLKVHERSVRCWLYHPAIDPDPAASEAQTLDKLNTYRQNRQEPPATALAASK